MNKECDCKERYAPSLSKTKCIKIPEHAHEVDSDTDVWLCDDGYEEAGNSCVEIVEEEVSYGVDDGSGEMEKISVERSVESEGEEVDVGEEVGEEVVGDKENDADKDAGKGFLAVLGLLGFSYGLLKWEKRKGR
ncbi:hypothetical protein GF354_04750 [Candidatus Peregrinibacteria bacterium]|nr:hypothetical protein [Candidatus Peregrinibacteria bacterium]